MKLIRLALIVLVACTASVLLTAQSRPSPAPLAAVAISHADIDAVLKHTGNPGGGADRQMKVVDLGSYNLGVGILQRGKTTPGAPVSAISHPQVTEVFYVVSGSATLVTGGTMLNPQPYASTVEFVQVAVGPSLGGTFQGGERRHIETGDVIVVPAGLPHGFDDITDHLTYLSVRPDIDRVLPAGYIHPALKP